MEIRCGPSEWNPIESKQLTLSPKALMIRQMIAQVYYTQISALSGPKQPMWKRGVIEFWLALVSLIHPTMSVFFLDGYPNYEFWRNGYVLELSYRAN